MHVETELILSGKMSIGRNSLNSGQACQAYTHPLLASCQYHSIQLSCFPEVTEFISSRVLPDFEHLYSLNSKSLYQNT